MLISPTTFYNENLKGKSKEEILSVIRRLKISITKLKKAIANPDLEALVCPSNELMLEYTRTYLEEAIIALNAVGGEYVQTKAELRSEEFDENISKISKIEFFMGNDFGDGEKRIYTIGENFVDLEIENSHEKVALNGEIDKKKFLERLSKLHIGEWKRRYTPKNGEEVLDGIEWRLHFYYEGGKKPIKIYWRNSFPYNFGGFMQLLDIYIEPDEH